MFTVQFSTLKTFGMQVVLILLLAAVAGVISCDDPSEASALKNRDLNSGDGLRQRIRDKQIDIDRQSRDDRISGRLDRNRDKDHPRRMRLETGSETKHLPRDMPDNIGSQDAVFTKPLNPPIN